MGTNEQGSVTIAEDGHTLTQVGVVPTSGGGDTMSIARGADRARRYISLSCPDGADPIVIDEDQWNMLHELIARSTGNLPSVFIPIQAESPA